MPWNSLFYGSSLVTRGAQVEVEMKKLVLVFAVYAEHAEAVRSYGQMLWSELDVGKMMMGTEEILNKLHKLKQLKLLPVGCLSDTAVAFP